MRTLKICLACVLALLLYACDTARQTEPQAGDAEVAVGTHVYELGGKDVTAFELARDMRQESFDDLDEATLYGLKTSMSDSELAELPESRRAMISAAAPELAENGVPLSLVEASEKMEGEVLIRDGDGEEIPVLHFLEHLGPDDIASLEPSFREALIEQVEKDGLTSSLSVEQLSALGQGGSYE